ncbi:MAG: hypothetical protein FWD09_03325 [Lentimicrobiaceae bacterium]|nr:hypothetical protein [Lentimicrobiaceae bacterium]
MNNPTPTNAPTLETIWELQQDYFRQVRENDRFIREKQAETDRQMQETFRYLKEMFAESRQHLAESRQQFKEAKEKAEKDNEDYKRRWKESEQRWEKYERQRKRRDEMIDSWSYNHGCFAEEYFFNSFAEEEQNFFGEKFDEIRRKVSPKERNLEDEYDIVLYNGTSVAIIEVKYKAHKNDIPQVLKKAETFKILCPTYKDAKIYLGLASLAFYPELEQECIEKGIAIIKQVGDTVIIQDGHLKTF